MLGGAEGLISPVRIEMDLKEPIQLDCFQIKPLDRCLLDEELAVNYFQVPIWRFESNREDGHARKKATIVCNTALKWT